MNRAVEFLRQTLTKIDAYLTPPSSTVPPGMEVTDTTFLPSFQDGTRLFQRTLTNPKTGETTTDYLTTFDPFHRLTLP